MRFANERMTTDEQVAFAWEYRAHFEEVRLHNIDISIERKRGNWDNKFRNAWAELAGFVNSGGVAPWASTDARQPSVEAGTASLTTVNTLTTKAK